MPANGRWDLIRRLKGEISGFLRAESWKCQYWSAYVAAALTWLKWNGCKVCETGAEYRHAEWRGTLWMLSCYTHTHTHTHTHTEAELLNLWLFFVFRARSQKYEKRLSASSCLSVCPHGTTRLPLGGYSWWLISEDFSKICPENTSFYKIWQE